VFPAFWPSKKACGIHKFRHLGVRQQYPRDFSRQAMVELVASFGDLSKLLKLWKKTETCAARKSTAHGLENVPISASLFHALARSPTHFSPRTARRGGCGLLPEPRRAGSVLQKTRNQLYCRNRRILLIPSNGNG